MSRPVPVVRRAALLAVAGASVAALVAGCSSGQVSQTAGIDTVTSGVDASHGDIQVRDARLAAPVGASRWSAGATVPVVMHLVNSGDARDRLVRATSPAAASVRLTRAAASATSSPGGTAAPGGTASPGDPASTEGTGSATGTPPPASAGPTVSPSPPPSAGTASPDSDVVPSNPQTTAPVATPTDGSSPNPSEPAGEDAALTLDPTTLVTLDDGEIQLLLVDLERGLGVGELVEVTLEFERAGPLTLRLPVATPATPLPRTSLTHGDGGPGDEGGHGG